MNNLNLYRSTAFMGILLSVLLALGCGPVVKPGLSSEIMMLDETNGLAFGTIHLTRDGKTQSAGLKWPGSMRWWVEDETDGKRFLISPLPIDGPFALKLPAGSYRVIDISFDGARGIWHTVLPTTFRIQPHHCTALGTWALEMQTGFLTGWMTRHVSHEQASSQDYLGGLIEGMDCPTLVALIESPVKRLVKLHFHTRGSGRF